ncbi:MAG: ribosome biogenesis GTP-binding protein YihA/YsxC, partial [Geminicoccaceae bacterium]
MLAAAEQVELDDAASLEAGRRLFAQPCTFVAGIADLARLPPAGLPEVAFAGRSNVGKSSLINALTGRGQLARISQTPGRTQQINLFDLGGRLMLVDLPGYGFAQAPKPKVDAWQKLVRTYLRGRSSLVRTCVLVDARHGLKEADQQFTTMLGEVAVA